MLVLVDVGMVVEERRGGISKGKARVVRRRAGSMMTLMMLSVSVACACVVGGVKGRIRTTNATSPTSAKGCATLLCDFCERRCVARQRERQQAIIEGPSPHHHLFHMRPPSLPHPVPPLHPTP